MAAKTNTTKSIGEPIALTDRELEEQIRALGAQFNAEKKVKFSIPVGLQRNIGHTLFLAINGVSLVIPVDGEDYEIPETFAEHGKQYLKTLTT